MEARKVRGFANRERRDCERLKPVWQKFPLPKGWNCAILLADNLTALRSAQRLARWKPEKFLRESHAMRGARPSGRVSLS